MTIRTWECMRKVHDRISFDSISTVLDLVVKWKHINQSHASMHPYVGFFSRILNDWAETGSPGGHHSVCPTLSYSITLRRDSQGQKCWAHKKCQDINPTWRKYTNTKVLNLTETIFHSPNQTFNFTENCHFSQHLAISIIADSLDRPLHLRSRWTSEVLEDLHPFLLIASVSGLSLGVYILGVSVTSGLHSKILYIRTALKIYTDYIQIIYMIFNDIQWYSMIFTEL